MHEQFTTLASRAAAHAPLDNPGAVSRTREAYTGSVASRRPALRSASSASETGTAARGR